MNAKVTVFIRYKQAGASFSLYQKPASLSDLIADKANSGSIVSRFMQFYMALLGKGVEAPYVRISNEALNKDSLFYDRSWLSINQGTPLPNTFRRTGVKTVIDDDPDFRNTCALCIWANSNTKKGRHFMRFIPDVTVDEPNGLDPGNDWDTAFKKLVTQMVADQWCVKVLKDESENPPKPIKKVSRSASGVNATVETDAPHGLIVGDRARVSGKTLSTQVLGLWTIDTVPDNKSVTLRNSEGTTLNLGSLGTIRKHEIDYAQIKEGNFSVVTGRKAGRPFGVAVGRRKTKR